MTATLIATMTDTQNQTRGRLMKRYVELSERLSRIEEDRQHRQQALSENWTERSVERENDEVLDGLAEATHEEIAKLRYSLARLEQGRYGICEQCGGPIGAERLQAVPYATRCFTCAADKKAA